MKPGFAPGIVREIVVEVTEATCPEFDGVIIHRCYSTWSVAHHFELAARTVLAEFLQDDEEGVGAHVSVDHLAPCPVGRRVRVRAELVEVVSDRNVRVVCAVSAHDGERLLAEGRQVQIVMNKEKLKDELADIFSFALLLANKHNLNLKDIVLEKIEKNKLKYPVNKAKGTSKKYTEL